MGRCGLLIAVMLGVPTVAFAHKLLVTVTLTHTEIQVQTQFEGEDDIGGPATVELWRLEPAGVVAKQPADQSGRAIFTRPEPGKYRVVAEDDFGHRAESKIILIEAVVESSADAVVLADDAEQPLWLRIGIGLGVIASIMAIYFLRKQRTPVS